MNRTKITLNFFLILIVLMLSIQVCSAKKSDATTIDKKNVVDEIDRSEIEEIDSSQVPIIGTIIPTFEMPDFKINVEDYKKKPKLSRTYRNENIQLSKLTKKKKKVKILATSKVLMTPKLTPKSIKVKRKKPVVIIKRPLKSSQIILSDIILIEKGKTVIMRSKGKYVYKYRYKGTIPLDSKGLNMLNTEHFLVVDRVILLNDINKNSIAQASKNQTDFPENIMVKRKSLEKKFNRGKVINNSIPSKKLKLGDVIYTLGDIQMVARKAFGSFPIKKFWLYPTINLENSSFSKVGNESIRL